MRPLLVSTYDLQGGAARAAHRLHQGLRRIGVDSTMLVQRKQSDDRSVRVAGGAAAKAWGIAAPHLDALPLRLYPQRQSTTWSVGWLPSTTERQIAALPADVVHLHWIGHGFVPPSVVPRLQSPLVWTLHDMWAFTGGCHYAGDCLGYARSCGQCPQLSSTRERDLSRRIWRRKQAAWEDVDFTVVTPSRWLADCARASSLFGNRRIETIPYGLDLQRFRPIDRATARSLLSLPADKKLVLFGATSSTSDLRKGFHLLQPALRRVAAQRGGGDTELVVFGASEPESPPDLGLPVHYTGPLHDELSLALLYSAVDVFVAPSVEDNLPNTVMEAMACGTPVVAFAIGGMPDMIEHGRTGYLAEPFETDDLARGILWTLEDEARWRGLGVQARGKAQREFELCQNARRYEALYRELVEEQGTREIGRSRNHLSAEPVAR